MNNSTQHTSHPNGHALDGPRPETSSGLLTRPASLSRNQKPCELQAGTQSGVISDTIIMTTKDITPTIEPRLGEPQVACPYQSRNQPLTEKEESGAIAVAPLSSTISVDDTSLAPEPVQAELDECNSLDDALSTVADRVPPLEIPAQAEDLEASRREETASAPHPISQPTGSYLILDELRELLGCKVILIPIPRGQKGPMIKGWQNIKLPQTEGADYQWALAQGNIGVLLGAPSEGLCAIDIDADGELEGFLALNPVLRETLITKGARGAQVWCEVEGDCPPLTKLKTDAGEDYGEWRGTGGQSVVHGIPTNGSMTHHQSASASTRSSGPRT